MRGRSTRLLGNRGFVAYWSAHSASQLGDRIAELALPLVAVTVLQATPTQVGLLTAAVWLPYLVSLFIGGWVDRRPAKRRIMVGADLVRVVVLASVPVAYLCGTLSLANLYVAAALLGLCEVFFNTATPSVFVSLVARDTYVAAGSALGASRSGSFIAGPALGGWLVHLLGAPVALLADSFSFLCSALLLRGIRLTETAPPPVAQPALRQAWEGLRFVLRHRYLRAMLGCSATMNFFTYGGSALLVLYASRTLGLSSALIGLAFGIGAAGSLLGAVAAPSLGRRWGIGHVGLVGALVHSASFAVPVLAGGSMFTRAAVLTAATFTAGIGVMFYDVSLNAVKTAAIPDDVRGRVTGAYSTINYGIRPLGAILGGLLGSTVGIRPTFVIAAVGGMLSIVWLLRSPLLLVRAITDLDGIDPTTGSPQAAVDPHTGPAPLAPTGRTHA